ncbi:type II toxin-antitoxin system RelB/DinJ family antitoxin [Chakrabartyella piscis]|uniref:type II toxin-antitoxin system RelB/DinJ family antitoxin n=1 Tax=Chakrabartyella piscis TaxID=2918914 RepID=UPI002958A068|nr:type II toxin-antitoxin system RelB/DinJ family antitoxin [Chakrabartyella piscis]
MANMNIRMDDTIKKQAEELFADLGMNMTTAINIFLKQAVRENKIPFEISRNIPNQTTLSAFIEGDKIAYDPTIKGYHDMDSLRKALEI